MDTPEKYYLSKRIWTEGDFKEMNWHDCPIHAMHFGSNFEFSIDIDYIFKWVLTGDDYSFWISPCSLVFENVYDLEFDIGPTLPELNIDVILMENPQRPKNSTAIKRDIEYNWTISTQEGNLSFKAVGYNQYVRVLPMLLKTQRIPLKERGGVSFEKVIT